MYLLYLLTSYYTAQFSEKLFELENMDNLLHKYYLMPNDQILSFFAIVFLNSATALVYITLFYIFFLFFLKENKVAVFNKTPKT